MDEREVIKQVLDTIKEREIVEDGKQTITRIFEMSNGESLSVGDIDEILYKLNKPLSRFFIQKNVKSLARDGLIEFAGKQERRNISGGTNRIPVYKSSER